MARRIASMPRWPGAADPEARPKTGAGPATCESTAPENGPHGSRARGSGSALQRDHRRVFYFAGSAGLCGASASMVALSLRIFSGASRMTYPVPPAGLETFASCSANGTAAGSDIGV